MLVVPFKTIGDASHDWAGKGVQQNLLADLAAANLKPSLVEKPYDDTAAAVKAAADAGIQFVIVGTVQSNNQQMKLTGQIVDAATGKPVGGLSATGPDHDLFAMEDGISQQAIQTLSKLTGTDPATMAASKPQKPVAPGLQQPAVTAAVQPPAAVIVVASGDYNGSALQQYVDANRTPSVDYQQQVQNVTNLNTYGTYSGFGGVRRIRLRWLRLRRVRRLWPDRWLRRVTRLRRIRHADSAVVIAVESPAATSASVVAAITAV